MTIHGKAMDATGISTIKTDNRPARYYNLAGIEVERPAKGVYIRGNKKYLVR